MNDINSITINCVSVTREDDGVVRINGTQFDKGVTVHIDNVHCLLQALGLMGFDLRGYTTAATIADMGGKPEDTGT